MSTPMHERGKNLAPGRRLTPKKGKPFAVRLTDDGPDRARICVAAGDSSWRSRTPGTVVAVVDGPAYEAAIAKVAQAWNALSNELERRYPSVSQPKFHLTVDRREPKLKLSARNDGRYEQEYRLSDVTDAAQWDAAACMLAASLLSTVDPEYTIPPHIQQRLGTIQRLSRC